MKIKMRHLLLSLLPAIALTVHSPLFAFSYLACHASPVDWGWPSVNFYPSSLSFPVASPARFALEAAFDAWNLHAPGSQFRFSRVYDNSTSFTPGDGRPSISISSGYAFGSKALAVAISTDNCGSSSGSSFTDQDIVFNPAKAWDFSTAPSSPLTPYSPYSLTMVAIHEMGHAMGLQHYNSVLDTMNSVYPNGGTLGAANAILPLSDAVLGDRFLYGICCPERDVFVSLYQPTDPGSSNWIQPAPISYRGKPFSLLFSVGNRGTQTATTSVDFYLSADRTITPADLYLGSSNMSMEAGATANLSATFSPGLPIALTPGWYYVGYLIDPLNNLSEVDETNNSVAQATSTFVPNYTPPTACFSVNRSSGQAPLPVAFDGGCSNDPDGSISTYSWDFGDGFTGSGATASHTYSAGGSYVAILTVTDNGGTTSQTSRLITVLGGSCIAGVRHGKFVPCP